MRTLLKPVWDYIIEMKDLVVRGWGRFWFTPTDPTTLAVIRICTGLVLTYIYATCIYEVDNFVGPTAFVDNEAVQKLRDVDELAKLMPENKMSDYERRGHQWYLVSVYRLFENPVAIRVTYAVFLAAMICLTLGLYTRPAAVLAWIGHISFINRGYLLWFGMDAVLAMLTLYLMIGPSGAVWSIDNVVRRFSRSQRALAAGERLGSESPAEPSWTANLSIRLIQVHMCIIYFCSGCAKLQGSLWWSGHAVWFTLMIPEFRLVDVSWIAKIQTMPWLPELVSSVAVAATILFEAGFPFLIYVRVLRPLMLFTAVALHVGIGFFMGLGAFGCAMLTGVASFIAPSSLQWVAGVIFKGPGGFRFVYDRHEASQVALASWIHAIDPWQQVQLVEANTAAAPTAAGSLMAPDGATFQGWGAFRQLARSLRVSWLLWPVLAWRFAVLRSEKLTPVITKP
jgi:hypothetical protein